MTISTTGMIEAIREAAIKTETLEEHDVLNSIANRIEILTTANAGMDLELKSIRAALNIQVNTSVQAGVIAETSRLNDEVLSLRSELSESVALANKLRRTAKECQEENQSLRTELADLREQKPVAWKLMDAPESAVTVTDNRHMAGVWRKYGRSVTQLYAAPVPLAASQLESDVSAVVGLLEEHEWAEHCTKTELGQRLEHAITQLHNERGEGGVA